MHAGGNPAKAHVMPPGLLLPLEVEHAEFKGRDHPLGLLDLAVRVPQFLPQRSVLGSRRLCASPGRASRPYNTQYAHTVCTPGQHTAPHRCGVLRKALCQRGCLAPLSLRVLRAFLVASHFILRELQNRSKACSDVEDGGPWCATHLMVDYWCQYL